MSLSLTLQVTSLPCDFSGEWDKGGIDSTSKELGPNCSSADDEMAVIREFRPFEMMDADGVKAIHVCCGPEVARGAVPKLS